MKALKECPILIGLVIIAIALSVVSFIGKDTVYAAYKETVEEGDVPLLALAFKGARDQVYPWSSETVDPNDIDGDGIPDIQEAAAYKEQEEIAEEPTETAEEPVSEVVEIPVPEEPVEEVYEFTTVDDEYFNDAVFIGDSRTVGLSEYCEELDTRATFYSKVSLTIFDVMKKEFIQTDKGKIGLEEALLENRYGKIYIMLGLNEIGTGNAEYFRDAYAEVLERIKELQPDATIYIEAIMHVTKDSERENKNLTNQAINERNEAIRELCDDKQVFYIDINEAVDDEEGNLDSTLSFDGVHLKASSYELWHEYLLNNAIVR